jgi:hypothetical protein
MNDRPSEELIHTVISTYVRARSAHHDLGQSYRAAVRVLMERNPNLSFDEAVDCFLAMLLYVGHHRPHWLRVERKTCDMLLRQASGDIAPRG